MPFATRHQVMKLAALKGIIINDDGEAIEVEAPDGYILSLTDSHCSQRFIYGNGAWKMPEIWSEVTEYLEAGIEPCPDPDCDCHDDTETK